MASVLSVFLDSLHMMKTAEGSSTRCFTHQGVCKYWFDQNVYANLSGTNTPNITFREAVQSSTGRLLSLSALLQELLDSVKTTRYLFKKRALTLIFGEGMDSLPDELLAYIMDMLNWGDSEKRGQEHLPMTHVCRRFRTIALQHNRLWRRISGSMSLPQVENFLQRSGECTIDIDLSEHANEHLNSYCPCMLVLPTLVEHCHRWERISWTHGLQYPSGVISSGPQGSVATTSIMHNLYLPSLRYLKVLNYGTVTRDGIIATDACNTWSMPNLETIASDDAARFLQLTSKIASLSLQFWEQSEDNRNQTLAFFASEPVSQVQVLKLDLRRNDTQDSHSTQSHSAANHQEHIELNELKMLVVDLDIYTDIHALFNPFIHLISAPQLRWLVLRLRSCRGFSVLEASLQNWLCGVESGTLSIMTVCNAASGMRSISLMVERMSICVPHSLERRPYIRMHFRVSGDNMNANVVYLYDWEQCTFIVQQQGEVIYPVSPHFDYRTGQLQRLY